MGHASIMMRYGEQIIHVDPYGDVADYGQLPDADLILITHHHGDHFDTLAIAEIERPTTQIIGSPTVIRELKRGKALRNGSQTVWNEIPIRAVPAYNRISMRSPGVPFHIRGEGNGYPQRSGNGNCLLRRKKMRLLLYVCHELSLRRFKSRHRNPYKSRQM